MLRAEELMVGDWVQNPHGLKGRVRSIKYIPKDNADNYGGYSLLELVFSESTQTFPINDAKPIPLTPEILEKNGFERRDDLVESIEDPLPFIYEDKETTESVSVGWRDSYDNGLRDENAEYFEEYWKIWIDAFDVSYEKTARILYVHELQNAIRLCGINKTIEL